MELKKSPKADLQNKKGIFTQIGLIIALLLVWGMLSVTKSKVEVEVFETAEVVAEVEIPEVVRPEEPPKPKVPRYIAPTITEEFEVVDNDTELENQDIFDAEANEDKVINIYGLPEGYGSDDGEIFVPEDDGYVMRAEKMPIFNGRPFAEFNKWVESKVTYPAMAQEMGITGAVVVQFLVNKEGRLTDFKVLTPNVDKMLQEEVLRVLKLAPKGEPAEQRGRPVAIMSSVRIVFRNQ